MNLGLSGNILPIHPQPKTDEIFSSWFCRIAQANEIKLHTLEVKLWGRAKQIWTRDIDRFIDEPTLALVASKCGTTLERARETCLRSYEGNLFKNLNVNGNSDWVLPMGIFHRIRKCRGMQFCPLCLASDATPYYRKAWRLALCTFCDLHDVMLHDCCPQCQAPVMFHREELGQRWTSKVDSLTLCTTCGFDLKRAPCRHAVAIQIDAWITLKSQLFFLNDGWTFNSNLTFPYSHLYFDVLRNLLAKLLSRWTPERLLRHAQEILPTPDGLNFKCHRSFELYEINERHYLLQLATWYLMNWPERLLTISEGLGVRHSELVRDFGQIPFWFLDGVSPLEYKPLGPSKGENEAMRKILLSEYPPAIKKMLRRAIGHRIGRHSINRYFSFTGKNL